jgi:alpha-glucosidase
MRFTGQKPLDPLILVVFPPHNGDSSEYTLYEDAGNTRAYEQNEAARTTIRAEENDGDLTVRIDPARGTYPGMVQERINCVSPAIGLLRV